MVRWYVRVCRGLVHRGVVQSGAEVGLGLGLGTRVRARRKRCVSTVAATHRQWEQKWHCNSFVGVVLNEYIKGKLFKLLY